MTSQDPGESGDGPATAADDIVDAEIVGPTPEPLSPAPAIGPPAIAFDYTDQGVPTLDYVRDKIEGKLATAEGMQELAGGTPQVRDARDAQAERERLAAERLAEIRKSLGHPGTG